MKYVMIEAESPNGTKIRYPIIFPNSLVHADVAEAISHVVNYSHPSTWKVKTISAGDAIVAAHVSGGSRTLELNSLPEDNEIIKFNDYGGGIV